MAFRPCVRSDLSAGRMSSSRCSSNSISYVTFPLSSFGSVLIFMAYKPGRNASTDFNTETMEACSFFATFPDTKIPRWPTCPCSRPIIVWPRALISSVEPYTSATQLKA